jgi:hypothetical protein
MIYPPAANCRNKKQKWDEQGAFAIRHPNDDSKQHRRKQNRYTYLAAFDALRST